MSSVTEDYIKKIYIASQDRPEDLVSLGVLADAMDLTPGTITSMMKTLSENGLVEYIPRTGVRLTGSGRSLALDILRRHRLIELFLVEVLGLDWTEVHEEAEILEHVFSKRILNRIDELLEHPALDPHGDPIPRPDGSIPEVSARSLADFGAPSRLIVNRVDHSDAEFLEFIQRSGLKPGSEILLERLDRQAGIIQLDVQGRTVSVSFDTAEKIFVSEMKD